jgi:RHH-type rel operon transcriptional repressor/antitoxin RelB
MLSVKLPVELERRLRALAEETGRSKSYYVVLALQDFLDEHEEFLLELSNSEEEWPSIL